MICLWWELILGRAGIWTQKYLILRCEFISCAVFFVSPCFLILFLPLNSVGSFHFYFFSFSGYPKIYWYVYLKSKCRSVVSDSLWPHGLWPTRVHGIFQVRILEWVTISFSRRSSLPRDQTQVSHLVGRHFTIWATREVTCILNKF